MDEAMGEDYDLLLGRRTYEIFAAYWPFMDDGFARKFNAVDKYVAAGPETPLTRAGSHRLEGDLAEAVRALKANEGRDLLIQGSSEVIHTLLAHDLIDQLTLLTFPVILGSGKRLFDDGSQPRAWALTKTRQSTRGLWSAPTKGPFSRRRRARSGRRRPAKASWRGANGGRGRTGPNGSSMSGTAGPGPRPCPAAREGRRRRAGDSCSTARSHGRSCMALSIDRPGAGGQDCENSN
jgi:dihydrofolate reductase